MPTNKDNPKGGSQSSMGKKSDREFESQGTDKGYDEQGQQAGGKGSSVGMDDEDVDTAGGRQGQFSDQNRGSQGQWSPGSGKSNSE